MSESPRSGRNRDQPFLHRVLIVVGIAAAVVFTLALIWYAVDVLLLAFAAILLAVLLTALRGFLARHTGMSNGWALALVVSVLVGAGVLLFVLIGAQLGRQFDELSHKLPQSLHQFETKLQERAWGRWILAEAPRVGERLMGEEGLGEPPKPATQPAPPQEQGQQQAQEQGAEQGQEREAQEQAPQDQPPSVQELIHTFSPARVLSRTFTGVISAVIVFFVALYLAAQPGLYLRGFLHLVARHRRQRVQEVLEEVRHTLQGWLGGQVLAMTIVGVCWYIGLTLLGVPLALALAVIAGLLDFIPNLGPVLAVIPAALLALTVDPMLALWVVLLYAAIQTAEAYLITPMIQQRAASLPPALVILVQVMMGVLAGPLGLLLAAPMTAAAMVLVTRFYIEDALGDRVTEIKATGS